MNNSNGQTAQNNPATGAAGSNANDPLVAAQEEIKTLKAHLAGRDRQNSKLEKTISDLQAQVNTPNSTTNAHSTNDSFSDELGELAGPIAQLMDQKLSQFSSALAPQFEGIMGAIGNLGTQTGSTNEAVFRTALTQTLNGYETHNESDEFKNFLDTPIEFGGGKTYRDKWDESLTNKDSDTAAAMWNKFRETNAEVFKSGSNQTTHEVNSSKANNHVTNSGDDKVYTSEDLQAKLDDLNTGKIDAAAYQKWKTEEFDKSKAA